MTEYTRKKIDVDDSWLDILPEGCDLIKLPELPKIKFRQQGVQYECTDLRCLNELAVAYFTNIVNEVCENPGCYEVCFDVSKTPESQRELVTDILFGIRFGYSKGGKNGFTGAGSFIAGARHERCDDSMETVFFELPKDVANAMRQYAQGKDRISYIELVIAVADDSWKRMREFVGGTISSGKELEA